MKKRRSLGSLIGILGPGFVSGAADNDPAGIATYTQAGAQFGYGQLWTALFALPLLIAVQEACARIGAVTGKGLATVIKENYSARVLYAAVSIILITNTINIGADIGAMGEAIRLIVPIPFIVLVLAMAFITLTLEIHVGPKWGCSGPAHFSYHSDIEKSTHHGSVRQRKSPRISGAWKLGTVSWSVHIFRSFCWPASRSGARSTSAM